MTVPNEAEAAFRVQAGLTRGDFEIMAAADAGTGVVSGCAVTAQAVPDASVAVAAGTGVVGNADVAVAAGNVAVGGAGGADRFDLVVVNSAGVKSVVAGAESATRPVFPNIPSGSFVLAAVYRPVGAGTVLPTHIVDKRAFVRLRTPEEIVRLENLTDVTCASTTTAVSIPALSYIATKSVTRSLIIRFGGRLYHSAINGSALLQLFEDNAAVPIAEADHISSTVNAFTSVIGEVERENITPGDHTYDVRLLTVTTGTAHAWGAPAGGVRGANPTFLTISEG